MAQQTAVEWLVEQIKDYDFTDPKTNEYLIFKIPIYSFIEKIEQAKEKEKEQMIDFYNWMRRNDSSEEYFHYSDEDMLTEYLNKKQIK